MIRSLSLGLTTVLQAPERRDATHGLPSGLHTSGRTSVCFELIQSLLRVDTESASGRYRVCFGSNHTSGSKRCMCVSNRTVACKAWNRLS